jgi:hypothetical protein
MRFNRLRMFLIEGVKLLQMVDFDLFLIEFLFSLKLSLEFLVRSEKFKVLKVILDDRIPKFNIDL